jgi:CBS domain-containing protein
MHRGILSCDPDASLAEVADLMARHRVHALMLSREQTGPAEIVSALDVVAGMTDDRAVRAAQVAATESLAIAANEPLSTATHLMAEHEVTHLIVLDPGSRRPVGVLSTIDLVTAYARAAGVSL